MREAQKWNMWSKWVDENAWSVMKGWKMTFPYLFSHIFKAVHIYASLDLLVKPSDIIRKICLFVRQNLANEHVSVKRRNFCRQIRESKSFFLMRQVFSIFSPCFSCMLCRIVSKIRLRAFRHYFFTNVRYFIK